MALSLTTVRQTYTANGSNTSFAIPFTNVFDDSTETFVYSRDESETPAEVELQVEGDDYDLTGAPDVNSFHDTVEFVTAPASGLKIVVIRVLPLTQILDAIANGRLSAAEVENGLDRICAMVQQLNEALNRTPKFTLTSPTTGMTFPEPDADSFIGWNDDGTDLENKDAADVANAVGALGAGNNLSDLEDVAEALDNLGISPLSTQTAFNITAGQSATALTGMTGNGAVNTSDVYDYEIVRGTTIFANGRFSVQYLNSTWRWQEGGYEGDLHGLTFTVPQVGSTYTLNAAANAGDNGVLKLKRHRFEV